MPICQISLNLKRIDFKAHDLRNYTLALGKKKNAAICTMQCQEIMSLAYLRDLKMSNEKKDVFLAS